MLQVFTRFMVPGRKFYGRFHAVLSIALMIRRVGSKGLFPASLWVSPCLLQALLWSAGAALLLMRGDGNKARRPLMVRCIACGSYNSTDA
jgi:hypothetical protein